MAIQSGFFDATEVSEGVYDRSYSGADFAHYFGLLVSNGVFPEPSTSLAVMAQDTPDMTVKVLAGSCWINGYFLTVTGYETLQVPVSDTSNSRIDSIIARCSITNRTISLVVVSGTPAATPVAVALTRNSDVHEIELAQILVTAGSSTVPQTVITDKRADTDRCGIVTNALGSIDVTGFFAQSNAEFQAWFATIQGQLSGDVAGNLQNQINKITPILGTGTPTTATAGEIGQLYVDTSVTPNIAYRCVGTSGGTYTWQILESGTTVTVTKTPLSVVAISPLAYPRAALAAATDGNGNVLFGGGNQSQNVVEKYDILGNQTTLTNLSSATQNLAAATDGNGNVLFGGGYQTIATVDRYSKTGVRTALASLSVGRGGLAAATDGNGNVLFGGGSTASSTFSAVVDKYSPSGTRTTLTTLSVARGYLAAATDGNGNVLFAGGYLANGTMSAAVDKYDLSGTRTTLSDLSVGRGYLAAATDGEGNVLFAGGLYAVSGTNYYTAAVDKYSKTGTKTTPSALTVARYGAASATDGNGDVLFGGGTANNPYNSLEKYDSSGVRTTPAVLSQARSSFAAATDGNGNVLFGGGVTSTTVGTVDKYTRQGSPKQITLPPFSRCKFQEHSEEQQLTFDGKITVNTPNTGYFRSGGSITL